MEKVRILLVDDHTLVRRGLRKILECSGEIEVVGEAADGPQSVDAAAALHPDIVLMDIGLPGMSGIEATRRIIAAAPGTHVLMLSMHADHQYVCQSRAAGARGYLLKDADDRALVTAVLAVRSGATCFGTSASAQLPGPANADPH